MKIAYSISGVPTHVLRIPAYRQHASVLYATVGEFCPGAILLCASGSKLHAYGSQFRLLDLVLQKVSETPAPPKLHFTKPSFATSDQDVE